MNDNSRPILGFDYGTKRIGVAVGQQLTATATPLETVRAIDGKPDWDAITRLIEDWQPISLVVGLPYNMDGTEQNMTHAARRFCNKLNGRYQLPVYQVEELLSSIEAKNLLYDPDRIHKTTQKKTRLILDQIAAKLILETFFSQQLQTTNTPT